MWTSLQSAHLLSAGGADMIHIHMRIFTGILQCWSSPSATPPEQLLIAPASVESSAVSVEKTGNIEKGAKTRACQRVECMAARRHERELGDVQVNELK
eukprot:6199157-Pleurochrysis_carterae.AAC.4